MRNKIPRAVFELHCFTSKDDTRSHLQRVHCERTTGDTDAVVDYIAVATDGHRMATVTWRLTDTDHDLPERFALDPKACREITKGARKAAEFFLQVHSSDKDKGECAATLHKEDGGETSIGSEVSKAEFPPWRRVMPSKNPPGERSGAGLMGFDAIYLGEVTTFLKKCYAPRFSDVTAWSILMSIPDHALNPIRLDYETTDELWGFTYVLMPTRI